MSLILYLRLTRKPSSTREMITSNSTIIHLHEIILTLVKFLVVDSMWDIPYWIWITLCSLLTIPWVLPKWALEYPIKKLIFSWHTMQCIIFYHNPLL